MDGTAIVFCENSFATDYGKTAHGLVRYTNRYDILAVIDSTLAPQDSGVFLDQQANNIPLVSRLTDAPGADYLVIGMAPDGGRLDERYRATVIEAMQLGMNIDSGLHQFLGDDDHLRSIAAENDVTIRDIRRPPPRSQLHFFTGEIDNVCAKRIAVLGTDCGIGKRTTATLLMQALRSAGASAEMVGTGQTAWLQGARYSLILDSLVNDFVGGEIEHAIMACDKNESPDFILIEGQACLTHPAGSGGFEILGSGKPQAVILQHAPGRENYSGYDIPMAPVTAHIETMENLFGVPVIGLGINGDGISPDALPSVIQDLQSELDRPCCDPLTQGVEPLIKVIQEL